MINHAEKIDCGAFVSEKFWHHFWQKTFSAESIFDSAEKASVHPSRTSGRTEERLKSLEIFRSC